MKEDRMQFQLHSEGHSSWACLFTRKQWLSLLFRLHLVAKKLNIELTTPASAKQPKNKAASSITNDAMQAVKLDNVQIRVAGDEVRLFFATGDEIRNLNLKAPGVIKIEELLMTQAERADWDPQVAMDRLWAGHLAKNITQQARKK